METALRSTLIVSGILMFAAFGCERPPAGSPGQPAIAAAPQASPVLFEEKPVKTETAMFGAGCFWGVEATFAKVPGVVSTAVGYAGGSRPEPTYEEVCTDRTGHAEVVHIEFDPSRVSYDQLLEVFFANHDPTTLNRQGPDHGTQYRSVIFTYSPAQEAAARAAAEKLDKSGRFRRPVVTQIVPEAPFYRAEEYHQKYLQKRGIDVCH